MLGPNAAGKTTTIKLLTGLIKPTSGRACVCGYDMQTHPLEARRRLAFVPDFPFLYDKLTAWEFFRFTGEMFRLDAARIQKNAGELVDAVSSPGICRPHAGRTFARHPPAHRHRLGAACTTPRCS